MRSTPFRTPYVPPVPEGESVIARIANAIIVVCQGPLSISLNTLRGGLLGGGRGVGHRGGC